MKSIFLMEAEHGTSILTTPLARFLTLMKGWTVAEGYAAAGPCRKAALCKTNYCVSSSHLHLGGKEKEVLRSVTRLNSRSSEAGDLWVCSRGALQGRRRGKTLTKASSSPDRSTHAVSFPDKMRVSQPLSLSPPPPRSLYHLLLSSTATYFQRQSLNIISMENIKGSKGVYRPIRVMFDTPIYERAVQTCWHMGSYKCQHPLRVQLWEFELEDYDADVRPLLKLAWEVNTSMKMRDVEFEARRLLTSPEAAPPQFKHPKIISQAQTYARSLTEQQQEAHGPKLLGPREVVMESWFQKSCRASGCLLLLPPSTCPPSSYV
ncbi:hypothetical protein L3Q82_011630 [Scortum barcoo]|uniref:Uncharacterized protein n=1 Tax=Scortum barcoo TaxID=214431 RepID=A0ACB8W672_9TELE|nr:hypothetical protein L3Q82_011630 [Scortum barcoo]